MEEYTQTINDQYLRHFTSVDSLFKILREGFRLSAPSLKWEDKNDYYCVQKYAELTNQDVYVLCFCKGIGNIHHWSNFGHNKYGECVGCYKNIPCNIKLDKSFFEANLPRGIQLQDIIYVASEKMKEKFSDIHQLPLLKRSEYWVEQEKRIVVKQNKHSSPPQNIMIPPDAIKGINILLPEQAIYEKIKEDLIREFRYLEDKIIDFNGVQNSKKWISCVDNQIKQL